MHFIIVCKERGKIINKTIGIEIADFHKIPKPEHEIIIIIVMISISLV